MIEWVSSGTKECGNARKKRTLLCGKKQNPGTPWLPRKHNKLIDEMKNESRREKEKSIKGPRQNSQDLKR